MFPIFPDILQEKEVVIIFLTEIKRKKKQQKPTVVKLVMFI